MLTAAGRAATISCGVAAWSATPADGATDVLRRADAALYRAKRAGRNRVKASKAVFGRSGGRRRGYESDSGERSGVGLGSYQLPRQWVIQDAKAP